MYFDRIFTDLIYSGSIFTTNHKKFHLDLQNDWWWGRIVLKNYQAKGEIKRRDSLGEIEVKRDISLESPSNYQKAKNISDGWS